MPGLEVHHLNCGTLCPLGERWITGKGPIFGQGRLICHCLLVETTKGLVLIETGIGLLDIEHPYRRLGRFFPAATRPRLLSEETALRQIERMGYRGEDVQHIILTHAHLDHAGGIADFPHATIHLYAPEYHALSNPPTRHERRLYRSAQWSHGPHWAPHSPQGDRFFGLEAVRAVPELESEILLIPMPGHTPGHAAVAVRSTRGWLVHAGDAYSHPQQLEMEPQRAPLAVHAFMSVMDLDSKLRERNLQRLRALRLLHGTEVDIFCSHNAAEFDDQVAKARTSARIGAGASRAVTGATESI